MALTLVATATVTIPSGQTLATSGVATGSWTHFSLVMPAAFDGTYLHFLVSIDDSTYQEFVGANTANTKMQVGGGYSGERLPDDLSFWPYFKLQSETTQTATRDFVIVASK